MTSIREMEIHPKMVNLVGCRVWGLNKKHEIGKKLTDLITD
jgi:hypothetical protein